MLIDVLIPFYGDEEIIKDTVRKLFENSERKLYLRVVLVDNFSPVGIDNSFLKEYGENLYYIRNKKNIGRIGNWNKSLEYISSPWVIFLFAGDALVNLDSLISIVKSEVGNSEVICYKMALIKDGKSKAIGKYILTRRGNYLGSDLIKRYFPLGLMPWGPLQTYVFSAKVIRNKKFDNNNEYYADISFILDALKDVKIKLIPSIHLHWLANPKRTHFKISLSKFLESDFHFMCSYVQLNYPRRVLLKLFLCIRALIMSRHYGIQESLLAVKTVLALKA